MHCQKWLIDTIGKRDLPDSDVGADGFGDVLLAGNLQARGDGDSILDSLGSTVARCGKERVGCVTNLDDTSVGRQPAGLRVSPEKLEVDDGVWWGALHKSLEDGCPFRRSVNLVHTLQDLLVVDGVVPALGFATGCLPSNVSG